MFVDVQNLWQAQHFVNLHVQNSWQARHFVTTHTEMSPEFVTGAALCDRPTTADNRRQRNTHSLQRSMEVHKALRLRRILHVEIHKVLRLPRILATSRCVLSQSAAPAMQSAHDLCVCCLGVCDLCVCDLCLCRLGVCCLCVCVCVVSVCGLCTCCLGVEGG